MWARVRGWVAENPDWVVVYSILGALAVFMLVSCNTVEAAQALPQDWWIGLESLALALLEDLWSVIEWVV